MRSLKILLLSCYFIAQINSNNNLYAQDPSSSKHVIGARQCGFFSNFLVALGHILWCEEAGKQPVVFWDKPFLYYEPGGWNNTNNAWEYYFEQVSTSTYNSNDTIDYNYKAPNGFFFPWRDFSDIEMLRPLAYHIIEKYIKIKPFILDIVDDFYNKNMKNYITIGIHLRGTDKIVETRNAISPVDIIKKVRKYAYLGASTGKYVKYLIASDSQGLIDVAKAELGKNCDEYIPGEVIVYPAERSQGNTANHYTFVGTKKENGFFAKRGLDVLIEVLLLSRCNYFVHTVSNVSTAVIFFNPHLVHYQFDGSAKIDEIKIQKASSNQLAVQSKKRKNKLTKNCSERH